ncbi:DUF1127 domain-containing protein [Aliisedimentitalea scapharcae]|uniref:DUF1127 domain-containing protein n=1 Tax=Aliisedimentitalea scapharcae TaxID=1524259 RepID=A0ABZ2XQC4_9RHOB|nr:DUF1127 domain-containing protein [Rhodobacteraceae bacterium M382]
MAMTSEISTRRGTLTSNPLAFVDTLVARFSRYAMFRRTMNELSALSDRELSDLGLSRSQLRRVAHQAAYENN